MNTLVMPGIRIDPIWCPLELNVKPDGEAHQKASENFFERHGFDLCAMRSAKAMATGSLACMWAPHGDDDGVQLLSDWLMWALQFDDAYCDSGDLSTDPLRFSYLASAVMNRTSCPREVSTKDDRQRGFELTLQDIFSRFEQRTDCSHVLYLSAAHFQWMMGVVCGITDRTSSYFRSLDEHLVVRPMDGAGRVSVELTRLAARRKFAHQWRYDRTIWAIIHLTEILLTVSTDIASYAWEHHQKHLESNIVAILAKERGCSIPVAVDLSRHFVEELIQLFVDLKAELISRGDPEIAELTEDMSNIVRGVLEWQRLLPRYILSPQKITAAGDDGFDIQPIHEISRDRNFTTPFPRPKSIQWLWESLGT